MHQNALVLTRATNAGYKNVLECSMVPSAILWAKFITRYKSFSKHFVLLLFFLYSRDLLFYINVSWICGYLETIIQIKGSLFAANHIRCIPKTKPENTFSTKTKTTYFQVDPPKFKLFLQSPGQVLQFWKLKKHLFWNRLRGGRVLVMWNYNILTLQFKRELGFSKFWLSSAD